MQVSREEKTLIESMTPEEASGRFKAFRTSFTQRSYLGLWSVVSPLRLLLMVKWERRNHSETLWSLSPHSQSKLTPPLDSKCDLTMIKLQWALCTMHCLFMWPHSFTWNGGDRSCVTQIHDRFISDPVSGLKILMTFFFSLSAVKCKLLCVNQTWALVMPQLIIC